MPIRCLLVDDEPLALQLLRQHLAQLPYVTVAGDCPSAVAALDFLSQQPVDLMFLDIRMPQLSGLDLLKSLRHPPPTIITTAHRRYALEGFDLEVVDYLLKPVTFDRFFKAMERFMRQNNQPMAHILSSSEPRFIYLKSGYKYFKVDLDEILYAESMKDYLRVVTAETTIVSKYKLGDFEEELKDKGFLRIHRSYLVNMRHITAFTAGEIDLGEHRLPVGDSYRAYVDKVIRAPRTGTLPPW